MMYLMRKKTGAREFIFYTGDAGRKFLRLSGLLLATRGTFFANEDETVDDITLIQADGDELLLIQKTFGTSIPMGTGCVQMWRGGMAQFIFDNLPIGSNGY
jgi:hypothetical protein